MLTLFVLASFTGHLGIAEAVVFVSVIGFLLSWIAGATLRALPRSWPIAITIALGAFISVACTFYIALLRGGLIDLIISTVRFGPDV